MSHLLFKQAVNSVRIEVDRTPGDEVPALVSINFAAGLLGQLAARIVVHE